MCCQGSLSAGQYATSHHHTHDSFVSDTSVVCVCLYVVQDSPPAPNNGLKSVKIVQWITSVFQSMREKVFGASSNFDLHATGASSEQQTDNDNIAESRRLGNVLVTLDDVCTCACENKHTKDIANQPTNQLANRLTS